MRQNALQLGPEIDLTVLQAVVQGLNAHAIAGQNQPFLGLHPNGNRKHAAKSREAIRSPAAKGVENTLRVTFCLKDESVCRKNIAQFLVIKNLSIEDENC